MFLIGAFFGAWLADNERYHIHEVVGGMGGFGILAGLIAGNIHGAINLSRFRGASTGTSLPLLVVSNVLTAHQSQNPYDPPRSL